jgi:hypothetical protein
VKRVGRVIVSVVVLGAATLFAWRHYRIQPLPLPIQSGKPIYEAHNLRCPDPTNMNPAPIILEPPDQEADQGSMVRLRWEQLSLQELQKRIPEIFATREHRTIYVVYPGPILKADQSRLIQLLIQHDLIDRVCLIDSNNPPRWYPIRILMDPAANHS